MIQGVHAETVVFVDFDRATELVRTSGWPWLGKPGSMSTREVCLDTGVPRRFRVRAGQLQALRAKEVMCSVQLESPDGPLATVVRGRLTLSAVPAEHGTRLKLTGVAARELIEESPTSASACLRQANAYARSLLEGVAMALEAGPHPVQDKRPVRRKVTAASRATSTD